MKRQLLVLGVLAAAMASHAADSEIISSTPGGTVYPLVYGASEHTYLVSNGGFGSFENQGYCSSIVVDGDDIYLRDIIREYPGTTYWIKGHIYDGGNVEFVFPQPVATDGANTLYVSMVDPVSDGSTVTFTQATADNVLHMTWDGSELVQIASAAETPGRYDGMIGLFNAAGDFKSYAEQNVSYKIWDEDPVEAPGDVALSEYSLSAKNNWNESLSAFVYLGTDGADAWIQGLCSYLPDAWVKGSVDDKGNITIPSAQLLGIYQDYFIFFYGADAAGATGSKEYTWADDVTLTLADGSYTASAEMMINLGMTRPWFGYGMKEIILSPIAEGARTPVAPEWFEPEWAEEDGMGVADFYLLPEDVNGQALKTSNLYFRLYYNGMPVEMENEDGTYTTDFPYGQDSDIIMYIGEHVHFVLFFEPLATIGVQAVYKTGATEQCSEINTYKFTQGCADTLAGSSPVVTTEYFNLLGVRVDNPSGLCIRRDTRADGSVESRKVNVIR